MENTKRILFGSFLLGVILLAAACNGEPREGFYDRDHHRWYHEHGWRDCGEHDDHCR
jgi:LPS sulfotransferase NodH